MTSVARLREAEISPAKLTHELFLRLGFVLWRAKTSDRLIEIAQLPSGVESKYCCTDRQSIRYSNSQGVLIRSIHIIIRNINPVTDLIGINCATKLTLVILNTYTGSAYSLSANAEVFNGLVY